MILKDFSLPKGFYKLYGISLYALYIYSRDSIL